MAVNNIKYNNLDNQIEIIYNYAKEVELTKEYDLIFIDASTTTLQITEFLSASCQVTVVTNSILVSTILTKNQLD